MPRKASNLTGQRFSRLVVQSICRQDDSNRMHWLCLCDCGNTIVARADNLKQGLTRSCGCLRIETTGVGAVTHGMCGTSEYEIWKGIKKRCCVEDYIEFPQYGGRGITMCDEWKESFEAFYRDMGPRPSPEHSIDRRDNNKGYSKENCRWATLVEQANNRRDNLYFDFDGDRKTLTEWCREFGLNYNRIRYLILKKGMSFEDAIYSEE